MITASNLLACIEQFLKWQRIALWTTLENVFQGRYQGTLVGSNSACQNTVKRKFPSTLYLTREGRSMACFSLTVSNLFP